MPAPPPERLHGRNCDWQHVHAENVHLDAGYVGVSVVRSVGSRRFTASRSSMVDADFAKHQLMLLTREWYMHPNGQLPAYEWAFGDVNPPVHGVGGVRMFQIERKMTGHEDLQFLERVFQKLLLNFTWWVNRKDTQGRNVFQGGFSGLDNIGAVRSRRAAAGRRPSGSIRRDELDGRLHAQHDGDRARTRTKAPRLRGHCFQVLRSLLADRRRDEQDGRRGSAASGTRRTGSTTTICTPMASAPRCAFARPSASFRCSRWRHSTRRRSAS